MIGAEVDAFDPLAIIRVLNAHEVRYVLSVVSQAACRA
jgi:hypothetical protein